MSLFVGNVSKHVSHRELQSLFKKHGKCRIDLRDRYAFVQFDVDSHAEAAKKQLQHQTFHGLELNIQWSKNSGRFGENNKRKNGGEAMRKRSRSRENNNRWRKQDRWGRRSPSNQRRSSPSYSGNKDFEDFSPQCPRDQIILKKLKEKKRQIQRKHGQRQRNHEKQRNNQRQRNHDKQRHQSKQKKQQGQVGRFVENSIVKDENMKIEVQEQNQNVQIKQEPQQNNVNEAQKIVQEDGQIGGNQK